MSSQYIKCLSMDLIKLLNEIPRKDVVLAIASNKKRFEAHFSLHLHCVQS